MPKSARQNAKERYEFRYLLAENVVSEATGQPLDKSGPAAFSGRECIQLAKDAIDCYSSAPSLNANRDDMPTDLETRKSMAQRVIDHARERGTPIDINPAFIALLDRWVRGEIDFDEMRGFYDDMLKMQAIERRGRWARGAGTVEPETINLQSDAEEAEKRANGKPWPIRYGGQVASRGEQLLQRHWEETAICNNCSFYA